MYGREHLIIVNKEEGSSKNTEKRITSGSHGCLFRELLANI